MKNFGKLGGALLVVTLLIAFSAPAMADAVTNGDFSAGLSGWSPSGSVVVVGNSALLTANATLTQNITLTEGETLSFSWFFQANDYLPYNDAGYAYIDGNYNFLASVGTVGNYGNSGWQTYSINLGAGNHTIGAGVFNGLDNALSSQLYVANVTATPEPGSLFLLGTGLLGMGGAVRRKFKV